MKEPTETEAGVVIVSLEQVLPDSSTEELKAEFNTVSQKTKSAPMNSTISGDLRRRS
jgi:hypothetical protein